jgi:predicted nucleic acid-binding Zn ribbon protein
MPLYNYECKKCKYSIEVIRKMQDSEVAPTEEEVLGEENKCSDGTSHHDLERRLKSAPGILKGGSWGSGKGYW